MLTTARRISLLGALTAMLMALMLLLNSAIAAPPANAISSAGQTTGSGELDSRATSGKDNMGQVVTDLSDRLEESYAGTGTTYSKHGVPYAPISIANVLDNFPLHRGRYQASADKGVKNLNAYLTKFMNLPCSGKVILAGYSQGADVVMRSYKALSPVAQQRVIAVVLFGDPYFNPYASYDRGTFTLRPDGVGILGVPGCWWLRFCREGSQLLPLQGSNLQLLGQPAGIRRGE